MHTCPMFNGPVPHVGGPILPPGAITVLIAGMPAARVGDMCTCVGPPDVIAKLNAEFTRITRTPEMQKRIADVASTPMTSSPQEMADAIKRESEQWRRVIKAKRITLD